MRPGLVAEFTAANEMKQTEHQAPPRGQRRYAHNVPQSNDSHQAPPRGQRRYAHNVPQSNDSHMRLRLLGEMYTKLYDEACAKHNEAYVIGVAYSNLQTQILGANYTRPLNAQRPMNSCSQASPKLGGKDEREENPLSYFDKDKNKDAVKDLPSLDSTSEPGMNFRSPRRRGCRGAGSKLKNRAKYTADKANRSIRNDNLRTTEFLSPESHQGTSVNKSTFNDGKMFERNKQRGKRHVHSDHIAADRGNESTSASLCSKSQSPLEEEPLVVKACQPGPVPISEQEMPILTIKFPTSELEIPILTITFESDSPELCTACTEGSALPVAEQKDNVTNEGETVQERFVPLSRDQEEAINEAKDTLKDAEWKAKLKQKMNPTWFEDYKCQSCGTDPSCCWVNWSWKREPSDEAVDSVSPMAADIAEAIALSTMWCTHHNRIRSEECNTKCDVNLIEMSYSPMVGARLITESFTRPIRTEPNKDFYEQHRCCSNQYYKQDENGKIIMPEQLYYDPTKMCCYELYQNGKGPNIMHDLQTNIAVVTETVVYPAFGAAKEAIEAGLSSEEIAKVVVEEYEKACAEFKQKLSENVLKEKNSREERELAEEVAAEAAVQAEATAQAAAAKRAAKKAAKKKAKQSPGL